MAGLQPERSFISCVFRLAPSVRFELTRSAEVDPKATFTARLEMSESHRTPGTETAEQCSVLRQTHPEWTKLTFHPVTSSGRSVNGDLESHRSSLYSIAGDQ